MDWSDIRFIIYASISFMILVFGIIDHDTPDYWIRARWSLIQAAVSIWLTVEIIDKLARKREFELHASRYCQDIVFNICQFSYTAYEFLVKSGVRSQYDNSLLRSIDHGSSFETYVGMQMHTVEGLVFEKFKHILLEGGNLEPTPDQLKSVRYFCACSIHNLEKLEDDIKCIMPFLPEDSGFFEMYLDHIKDTKSWAVVDIKNGKSIWGIMSNVNLLLNLNTVAYRKILKKMGIKPPRQHVSLETRRIMPPP